MIVIPELINISFYNIILVFAILSYNRYQPRNMLLAFLLRWFTSDTLSLNESLGCL